MQFHNNEHLQNAIQFLLVYNINYDQLLLKLQYDHSNLQEFINQIIHFIKQNHVRSQYTIQQIPNNHGVSFIQKDQSQTYFVLQTKNIYIKTYQYHNLMEQLMECIQNTQKYYQSIDNEKKYIVNDIIAKFNMNPLANDKLQNIQIDLQSATHNMQQNIEKMYDNTAQLQNVEKQTEMMANQAKNFKKQAVMVYEKEDQMSKIYCAVIVGIGLIVLLILVYWLYPSDEHKK